MESAELQLEVAHIGDAPGVFNGLGNILKLCGHLFRGFEIEEVAGHLVPLLIMNGGVGADAKQQVVIRGIILPEVMGIVSCYQGNIKLSAHFNKMLVYLLQFRDGVPLYLKVEITKGLFIPAGCLPGFIEASGKDKLRHFTADTGREGDESFMVLGKQLFIHTRLIVEAFQVGFGGELNEVAVAGLVFSQQDKVVVFFISGAATGAALRSDVHFTADDRLYARLHGFQVELNGAVHHTVVGYCQGRHAQFFSPFHQLFNAAHAVKQAVFGVDMEVSEHERLSCLNSIPRLTRNPENLA